MAATPNSAPSSKATRSKIFLVLAIVNLMLMSLLSGADAAFFYIFSGIGAYCLFLAYWTRPVPLASRENRFEDVDLFSDLKNIFRSKQGYQYKKQSSAHTQSDRSKFIGIVFAFVFFLFFAGVFLSIILADVAEEDGGSLYLQAEAFRSNNQYDSAKLYYRKALNEDDQNADAFFGYGTVLLDEEAYDSAIVYYTRSIDINPEYDGARFNRSLAKYFLKQYDQSRKDAFDILSINPNYDDATLMIGDNYYAEQSYDSALYWYEEAYNRGLRSAWLSHVMGYIYDTKNQSDRAVNLYLEALSYDSSKAEIYQRLSELVPTESARYQQLYERYK
jgi:tetratricopeptide (TPR) repeat protein